jgi:O-antigen ligase
MVLSIHKSQSKTRRKNGGFPKAVAILFFIFSLYLVLPFYDVPLMGLSLSAPLFFFIAAVAVFKPPRHWFRAYQGWIIWVVLFWLGIFISAASNGILSGGVNFDSLSISLIIHYAYWMLVFVITAYFASQGNVLKIVCHVLGWGVLILALIRWGEVLVYSNYGAWSGTQLLTQNTYGFLFSTFSPFLLLKLFENRGWKKFLAIGANLILWGAAAINGSRGSWISIALGLAVCLVIFLFARPRHSLTLAAIILAVGILASSFSVVFPQMTASVVDRYNTMDNLEQEKSYMIRQLMIQKGWRLFQQSPVIGVGVGRFTKASVPLDIPRVLSYGDQQHFDNKSAHNSYLNLLAETGLMGGFPFAVLLFVLGWRGSKAAILATRKNLLWILAVFLGFVQMSIHMWVISSLTNTGNWFIYGLVAATIMLSKNEKKAKCV